MRTIINLLDEQLQRLAEVCKSEGLSRAEAVRRAVADYIDSRRPPGRGRDAVFGMWRNRKVDALDYERRLRREWF